MNPAKTILIADSSRQLHRQLHSIITRLGHKCMTVQAVDEALVVMDRDRPDMVLCGDEVRGGYADLCRQLKERIDLYAVPVVLVTRDPSRQACREAGGARFDGVLNLPVAAKELWDTIQEHLYPGEEEADRLVPFDGLVTLREGNLYRPLTVRALGLAGILLSGKTADLAGRVVEFHLPLPGIEEPVTLLGRFPEDDDGSKTVARVEFVRLDRRTAAVLETYLLNYLAGALSPKSREPAPTALTYICRQMAGA